MVVKVRKVYFTLKERKILMDLKDELKRQVVKTYAKEKFNVGRFVANLSQYGIDIPENIGFYDKDQKDIRDIIYDEIKDIDKSYDKYFYNIYNTYFKYFIKNFEGINDLSNGDLSRLMMLATYISSDDNYLKNDHSDIKLTKRDMADILMVSSTVFKTTYNELVNKGYLIPNDDGFVLNVNNFHYGKNLNRPLINGERYIKLYKQAIRTLYKSVKPSQHKLLGYMFKLIPYVNVEHWIICKNPLEYNKNNIIPLTINEICDIVGYSKENAHKFRREVNKVIFTFRDKPQRFMFAVLSENNEEIFTVNPNIVYGGNPAGKDKKLAEYFECIERWSQNMKASKNINNNNNKQEEV